MLKNYFIMKTIKLTLILICTSLVSFAQVGIGNTDPKASLDITASNTVTPSNTDGILIPKVDNFPTTNPAADQNGMLVFVTGNGTPTKGFYYWDSILGWVSINGAQKIDDLLDGKSAIDGSNDGFDYASSIFLGFFAGYSDDNTHNQNIGIGYGSLIDNNNGEDNIAIGFRSQRNTEGNNNIALGTFSLNSNSTGNNNIGIGQYSGQQNSTGSSNIFIGHNSGYSETSSNKLYIENSNADANNALLYGEFDTDILRTNGEFQIGNPTTTGYAFPTIDGTANQVLTTDGAGNITFENITGDGNTQNTLDQAYNEGGAGAGKNINATDGAVRINGTDGFLVTGNFTGGNTIDTEITGAGTRMFFNPNKAAFRSGTINSNQWDDVNIGIASFAGGANTIASGLQSVALGLTNTASGDRSISMGQNNISSGNNATTFGENNIASDANSFSIGAQNSSTDRFTITMGQSNLADTDNAVAIGTSNTSSGLGSFALGSSNNALGNYSFAMGNSNTASGSNSHTIGLSNTVSNSYSIAIGRNLNVSGFGAVAFNSENNSVGASSFSAGVNNTTNGGVSVAFGNNNTSHSYAETVIGTNATDYTASSLSNPISTDRLFTIGNGNTITTRSNALTIYKNGLMNINDEYNMPLTDGTNGQVMTTDGAGNITFQNTTVNTDDQNLTTATLTGTTLNLGIENGTGSSIDLAPLQDGTGTDNQNLATPTLSGTTLNLNIQDGTGTSIDLAALQDGTGNDWSLAGNSGTNATTDFIGTTDNEALSIRTNNSEKLRLTEKGQLETYNTGSSVFIGELAGELDDLSDNENVFIGRSAGQANTSGASNTFIGYNSGRLNQTGLNNIAIGNSTLFDNVSGINNIAIGSQSNLDGTGNRNITLGFESGANLGTGSNNIIIGDQAGNRDNLTSSQNVYLGAYAGGGAQNNGSPPYYEKTGNVFIGHHAGRYQTDSNRLFIENSSSTTPLLYGEFDNNILRTNGTFQINDPSATGYTFPITDGTANQVLTTDGFGNLTFETPTTITDTDWTISGSDQYSANSGNVGIGKPNPQAKLDVEYSGTNRIGVDIDFTYSGTMSPATGLNIEAERTTDGNLVGLYSQVKNSSIITSPSTSKAVYGFNTADAEKNEGVKGLSSGNGIENYGVVGIAYNASGENWAGYFGSKSTTLIGSGNVYVRDLLEVDGSLNYTDGNEALGYVLSSNANGDASWVDPSTIFTNTDNQNLNLSGTNLSIEDGNSVNLNSINTDNQTIDKLNLNGTTLELSLEDDAAADVTVDLSSLQSPDVTTFAAVKVLMPADQALTGTGWDKLNFDTGSFDVNGNFNTTTDRFVATEAGIYQVTASYHTSAASTSTNSFGIAVYIDGTINKRTQVSHYGEGLIHRDVTSLVQLTAGQYIEIYAYHTGGITIESNAGRTTFEVVRIR